MNIRPRSPTPPLPCSLDGGGPPAFKRIKLNPTTSLMTSLYREGLHLAPMVRIGTLPTRLLALEYGATLVWGPEIVDKAIIGSERIVDGVFLRSLAA
jgi:hypothetical protein